MRLGGPGAKDRAPGRHVPVKRRFEPEGRNARAAGVAHGLDGRGGMLGIDLRELLGGYAVGSIPASEARRLHEAALEDQTLFDALAEEDLLREALADRAFRERVKRRLRELDERSSGSLASWVRGRSWRPAGLVTAGTALGIAAAVLFESQPPVKPSGCFEPAAQSAAIEEFPTGVRPIAPDGLMGTSVERLWGWVRPVRASGVALGLNRPGEVPRYAVGDQMRIGFRVQRDAAVVLLSQCPRGVITRLFPGRRHSSPLVQAGERVLVPGAGQGYSLVAGPPGRYVLRLLVFPPDADPPGTGTVERQGPIAVERQYQVLGWQGRRE